MPAVLTGGLRPIKAWNQTSSLSPSPNFSGHLNCPDRATSLPVIDRSAVRTRPYTPRTNGKAERFIQTALREWAYAQAYPNSDRRAQELPIWLHR